MEGKEKSHLRWTERKHHTVCATGHSTMYARILVKCLDDRSVFDGAPDDVTVGTGGFPLVVGGELVGSICVSGLVDPGDHLLIVRALAEYLHRDVPPLPERVEMGWLPSM